MRDQMTTIKVYEIHVNTSTFKYKHNDMSYTVYNFGGKPAKIWTKPDSVDVPWGQGAMLAIVYGSVCTTNLHK